MTDFDFYSCLCKKSCISQTAISSALSFFDESTVSFLWDLFVKDLKMSQKAKIPYFQGGFYPHEFYSEIYSVAKSKNLPCEELFLYVYICFAKKSSELYKNIDLSEKIFFDTYRRIGEYAKEYAHSHGGNGIYDYHFCANHVVACVVRLGVFEYSYGKFNGKKAVFLHVPDGACLERQKRLLSYTLAQKLLGNYPIVAESWLLYPEHKNMLPPNSRILQFAHDFKLVSQEESFDYSELFHIFGRNADYSTPDSLPQETSLQKAYVSRIKAHLPIGSARAVLLSLY
ncbi:MAG: DUF5596 domain-containing protein [Clostridia bacterium]|nr:DUF5596 domain-containing protein [Clostridia bacterium]